MPRSRNARSFTPPQAGSTRQRQLEQIIEKASQLFTPRNRSAAGTYLAHAMDRDLFCTMLDSFEMEPISPEADLDFLSSHQSAMAAMRSMSDLATVMACLDAAMPPPGCSPPDNPVLAFVNQYMGVILERWGEILRWITFFIKYVPQSLPTWDKVMHSCAQVIEFSVKNADDNPCKGEIVTLPSTIDCILLLLCLRNPSTGQPSYLRDDGHMCSICTLVCASALSEIGNASVALRLASLDSSTTIEVTKSFLERIQGVLPRTVNANTIGVAAKELTQFLTSIWTLAPKQSRRAISEVTRVVSQVANGAIQTGTRDPIVWSSLTMCCEYLTVHHSQPSRKTDRMIEEVLAAGLIPTILRSLPHISPLTPRSLEGLSEEMLFWLVDSRMFLAAKKGGWNKTLFQDLDKSTTRLPRTKSIQEAYALALGLCELTFEGKRGNLVRLCCSMKHSNPIQRQEDVQSLKICSRCHSVVYCSEACQREDWVAFHSKECHQVYRHQRELEEAGLTERYRRDKAMFLAFVATRFLGDRKPTYFDRSMKDDDLPLHLFDFTGVTLRLTNHFVGIVEQTLADFFSQYVITPHAQARIRRCAAEMRLRPNIVLVAGAFIDRRIVTTICIQMQYSPYSADGERYKVIKAVSSVKLRSSLPEPEPLTEADAQLFADMGLGLYTPQVPCQQRLEGL